MGGDCQEELASGLRASSSCAVFIGPNGVGDWERLEFQVATQRMAKDRSFRVFLVLLPELPEPFDTSTLPPFLATRTWVDLRKGISDPRTFQQLVNAIFGHAPGPDLPIEPRSDTCPYRGLQPFSEEHAEFFFGRDADTQRLVEKLKTTRLLAVIGPSGSGKSSVVLAGLLPALRRGTLPESDSWKIQVFRPESYPLTSLAANLQKLNPAASAGKTLDELSSDGRTLHLAGAVILAGRPLTERVVWVIDQFEEVFTLCHNEIERQQFISNLLYAALAPGGRNVVVITMRADFYQKWAAYPELSSQITGQQFLVSPMSTEGLRRAIEEPAWRVGLEFEPGLVDTILDDVESQPGALPLLEHALLELWMLRRGRLLTLKSYRDSGGVTGAIAKRANAIYESLDLERQSIVRRIMLRLTQPGEGTEDTRRRATFSELITHSDEAEKVESVVRTMADARLLMTDRGEDGRDQTVDVSHEALIRGWPRLKSWIEEDRQGLRVLHRVNEAAKEWAKSTRDESLLFRGSRLAQALELRERNNEYLNDLERKFLSESEELRDREQLAAQRRTRNVIIGLVSALVIISAVTIFAFIQSSNAKRRGSEAYARELAANAMAQLPTDPELALILAIEAEKTASTTQTEDTLRQALARAPRHVFPAAVLPKYSGSRRATFSADGRHILVSNADKLQLYDTESGKNILEVKGDGQIEGIAYSRDGKLVAAMTNGTVQVWEVTGGRRVMRKQLESGSYPRIVFTPDGKFIVLWSSECRLIEIPSGREAQKLEGRFHSFSRDGKLATTLKSEGTAGNLLVYDTQSWVLLNSIPTTTSTEVGWAGFAVGAVNAEGTFAFVGQGIQVGLYDIRAKQILKTIRIGPPVPGEEFNEATVPVFSPDSKVVAFAANQAPIPTSEPPEGKLTNYDANRTLQVWDTESSEALILDSNAGDIVDLSFSPNSRFLIATDKVAAHLYDLESRRLITDFNDVNGLEFSPDGKYILVSGSGGSVSLWDLNSWRRIANIATATDDTNDGESTILKIDFDNDRHSITTRQFLNQGGVVTRVWDTANGKIINESAFHERKLVGRGLITSQDGKFVLDRNVDIVEVFKTDSRQLYSKIETEVFSARFSPDGTVIVTTGDNTVKLWDTNTGTQNEEFKLESLKVQSAALSWNKKLLLVSGAERLLVFDVKSKRPMWESATLYDQLFGQTVCFSPDDKFLVGIWDYPQVRDANTGRIVTELRGHQDIVTSAAFSPDSKFIVTTSAYDLDYAVRENVQERYNEVRVWDAHSGSTIYEFRDYGTPLAFAKFSDDGKYVLAVGKEGVVRIYACDVCLPTNELLQMAQQRRIRELTPDERNRYIH